MAHFQGKEWEETRNRESRVQKNVSESAQRAPGPEKGLEREAAVGGAHRGPGRACLLREGRAGGPPGEGCTKMGHWAPWVGT